MIGPQVDPNFLSLSVQHRAWGAADVYKSHFFLRRCPCSCSLALRCLFSLHVSAQSLRLSVLPQTTVVLPRNVCISHGFSKGETTQW